jgi:hypothetical protein
MTWEEISKELFGKRTAKRFTITQDFEEHHRQIRDNGHIIMGCFVEPQAEVIVDLLNQLNDENEQLKKENKELEEFRYAVFKNLHKITEKEHRE